VLCGRFGVFFASPNWIQVPKIGDSPGAAAAVAAGRSLVLILGGLSQFDFSESHEVTWDDSPEFPARHALRTLELQVRYQFHQIIFLHAGCGWKTIL
jgi:hypothetical protein